MQYFIVGGNCHEGGEVHPIVVSVPCIPKPTPAYGACTSSIICIISTAAGLKQSVLAGSGTETIAS